MDDMPILYRLFNNSDIQDLAGLRTQQNGDDQRPYWENRIAGYSSGRTNPQQSLAPRVIIVAEKGAVVGFIAGHLTRRFDCDGELQWIDVDHKHRQKGIASGLLRQLATWFIQQNASSICVNCAPDNLVARNFYKHHGAIDLNEHWLFWKDIGALVRDPETSRIVW